MAFVGRNWYLVFAYALGESFLLSVLLTALIRRLAVRWSIMDHPGERKVHEVPIPLLGGVGIFATFNLVILANYLAAQAVRPLGHEWFGANVLDFLGGNIRMKLVGIGAGGLLIFMLGVVDDLKALKPELKLVGQLAAALVLVMSGTRLDIFNAYPLVSGGITMLWVIMMTNSMNFLDNMDGLSGGVSVIAAFSFFLCLLPQGDTFVCTMLMVFAGAVAGFLYHNLSPARIFMGDSGAMFCGYILATVAVLGTFYDPVAGSDIAWATPILALSVPIFDTLSVVFIRWRRGESIMKGDKRHFSHRLVEAGMTQRQAVEFIFLVAAVTGLGAALLPRAGRWGAVILIGQTIGVFSLIVLLMQAGARRGNGAS